MTDFNAQKHWENIYQKKALSEVSWYQPVPQTSLDFILRKGVKKSDNFIDIGGGDSLLMDHLLDKGFTSLTVLDISTAAIERAKLRMGKSAEKITWIVEDMLKFKPDKPYAIWHDRAAFHFLTKEEEIQQYKRLVKTSISSGGRMIIGTFSRNGPEKCSGIPIRQYSIKELKALFQDDFTLQNQLEIIHPTPFNTTQEFVFVEFKRT